MSRLAQAGDNSTASPGRARAIARATATSSAGANSIAASTPGQRRGDHRRVAAEQDHRAAIFDDVGFERSEILALAVAAGDQHRRPAQALERGLRRGDRRALRIVDEQDAADFGDAFHPVRQAAKRGERGDHLGVDLGHRGGERQRRERIERVVSSDQRQVARGKQQRAAAREPGRPAALDQTPVELGFGNARTEGLHDVPGKPHRERARVVAVEDLLAGAGEDARLGARVGVYPGVAVEMIGTDVEHRRRGGFEARSRFELEARQFDDKDVGPRRATLVRRQARRAPARRCCRRRRRTGPPRARARRTAMPPWSCRSSR